ncbi:hypothetical protein VTK56DRAFT_9647 [Thermocarpiscus australiensis]
MGSMIATSSDPVHLQANRTAALLLSCAQTVLTGTSRPGTEFPPSAGAPAGAEPLEERPGKRIRLDLDRNASIRQCLESQVLPHLEAAISALPEKANGLEVGKRVSTAQPHLPFEKLYLFYSFLFLSRRSIPVLRSYSYKVLSALIGPEFTQEFTRGNGKLSASFEAKLAIRATAAARALSVRLDYPSVPATLPQPRVETPVPVPQIPHTYQADPRQPSSAGPTARRYSTTPIPLPKIPFRSPGKAFKPVNGSDVGTWQSTIANLGKAAERKPEVIVIDDDDDIPPGKPVVVGIHETAEPASASSFPKLPTIPADDSTLQDFRAQASKLRRAPKQSSEGSKAVSRWFLREKRPYLTAAERTLVLSGAHKFLEFDGFAASDRVTVHVDFSTGETAYLRTLTRRTLQPSTENKKDPKKDLRRLLKRKRDDIPKVLDVFAKEKRLPWRTSIDVDNFFQDLIDRNTSSEPVLLTIGKDDHDRRGDFVRSSRLPFLLQAREASGQRGFGSMRRFENFNNELRKYREDGLELRAEWTGCAGDISTIVWVSNDGFICGTTEHSDSHNQQYNKPGNLVLGSCSLRTMRAYPDHRIVRPVVEKGENSTEAMRQSQDPWLYSSVVSSDYDAVHGRAFTSGFDRAVKVWEVERSGASMKVLGEWRHGGNVNFVAASKHESGLVATAADVPANAVRIYNVNETDVSKSFFRAYSCSRVTDAEGNAVSTEKWAYYPATMQWGLAEGVKHLLLVGYSPRSRTGDDNDIPGDRLQTGELCLWDGLTGERWRITSATTQNVFEVLWHPTQPCFIAATSPLGLDPVPSVRTQIRIFRPADAAEFGTKAFSPVKALDCTAIDINELTIMPNSPAYCYVTAGCTDGCTYVWDTAGDDKPFLVLRHGEPIDEYRGDREREDSGVKFTAWGTTPDRFYTGSSDGVVKVWNIRSLGKPLVRHLLEAPAPITYGMFSPDRSKLVVGDASGRVFLLSVDEEEQKPASFVQIQLPGSRAKTIRRPTPIIRHPEPPPPSHDAQGRPIVLETGASRGHAYLHSQQLKRHPNPTIGVVQGPRYAETGLFRREAHFMEDPSQPLLASWEVQQQDGAERFQGRGRNQFVALRPIRALTGLESLHSKNRSLDLDVDSLPEQTRRDLEGEGVNFEMLADYILEYEEMPLFEKE